MTDLIYKIDQAVEEMSLLKHPFYRMWSNGELRLESTARIFFGIFSISENGSRNG